MGIHKAVTFRASSIGDALMAKYLLDNVHAQFPSARLALVVSGRVGMLRDLFAAYPYIEVIEANRRNIKSLWCLWREWRGSDFVVTQYAGKVGGTFSFATKLMARMIAKSGSLVGFADASVFNAALYDELLPDPSTVSPAENERRALRAIGLTVPIAYPILTPPTHTKVLQKFNLSPGSYILVHLFSGGPTRGLHPTKRRELVATLRAAIPPHIELLLTGGSEQERKEALDAAGDDARVIASEASLQETMQLVQHAAAIVSLDTGFGHIATQLHRPVYIISTCMGLWWWNEEQYGKDASYRVFSAPIHTISEHVLVEYPPCLNDIDIPAFAKTVAQSLT